MSDAPQFDRKMSDAEGLMWRLEKDPHLSSTFAAVTILDRSPDFDRLLGATRASRACGRTTRPACAAGARQPHRTYVGRRQQLRPAISRSPHRPAEARHDASTARSRQPHRLRSVRPDPAAVAVRRRRRSARWQVGPDRETAPHHHRRRRQRASSRCSSSTSNAMPPNRHRSITRKLDDRPPTPNNDSHNDVCSSTCWPAASGCRWASCARSRIC